MYDAILIPTDGRREMVHVADQAMALAELCKATLHVLHVVDERAYLTVPDDARSVVRDRLEEDGRSAIESIAARAEERGIQIHRELRWGDPAAEILGYAVEADVSLVVMGTHGRTGYERYLLGSVAEKVVRVSPIPVLTVGVGELDEKREEILGTGDRLAPSAEEVEQGNAEVGNLPAVSDDATSDAGSDTDT